MNHVIKNYFISCTTKKLFICASTANKLFDLLEAYKLEPYLKTLTLDWSNDHGRGNNKNHKLDLSLRL